MTTALPSLRETASLIVQDVCSGKRTAVEVLETYLDQIKFIVKPILILILLIEFQCQDGEQKMKLMVP